VPNQEVENVHPRIRLTLIQFRVAAAGAADGDEPLVLNVHQLGESATGCLELILTVILVAALWANVLLIVHYLLLHFSVLDAFSIRGIRALLNQSEDRI
jgi:hypothetical protein